MLLHTLVLALNLSPPSPWPPDPHSLPEGPLVTADPRLGPLTGGEHSSPAPSATVCAEQDLMRSICLWEPPRLLQGTEKHGPAHECLQASPQALGEPAEHGETLSGARPPDATRTDGDLTSLQGLAWGAHVNTKPFAVFVQLLGRVQLCDPVDCSTPGFPVLQYLPELAQTHAIESVMPPSHLILCHPLLLLPSIFPSIRVFSNEPLLRSRWPEDWSSQLQHQSFQ